MKNLKFSLTRLCVLFFLAVLIAPNCSKSPTESKPDPVKNLLPGASYMGYGYNIFGEYAKAEYLKSSLLKYESYQTIVVEGNSYNIPSEIQYISINTADFRSVYGVNSSQYRESLGINANLGASIPAFSLSITNNYSREYYTNNYRAFCTVQNIIKKWKLSLPYTDHHKLKSLLTNEAKNDLANLLPATLFNKYGTHFISEVIIGARADYNTSLLKSQATSSIKNNFQICAEASFKKGTGSGSFTMVTEYDLQTFESNSVTNTRVSGGRSEYGAYIFQSGNYERWIESIANINNLTIADFTENSLIPIWELCEDNARQSELRSAFDTYMQQFELPALVDGAITGLQFTVTTNPPITPERGWEMINTDLNRGTRKHDAYIYLCYQKGLDDRETISDITFIVNNQAVPAGFTKIPQDLNQGAGGDFIYLCYKKQFTTNPIRRVDILVGENAVPGRGFYFGENHYSRRKQDLNAGAGGNWIWLVYSNDLPDPWQ